MGLRFFVLSSALGLLSLGGIPAPATCDTTRDEAIVKFTEPVQVGDEWVMGRAVIVHDDAAKARGEACTFIYKTDKVGRPTLVAGYKCERVARPITNEFRLVTYRSPNNVRVLNEVQFPGQPFAHQFLPKGAEHTHTGN